MEIKSYCIYSSARERINGLFRYNFLLGIFAVILTFLPGIFRFDEKLTLIKDADLSFSLIMLYFFVNVALLVKWYSNSRKKIKTSQIAYAIDEKNSVTQVIANVPIGHTRRNVGILYTIVAITRGYMEYSLNLGFAWTEKEINSVIENPRQKICNDTVWCEVREITEVHEYKRNRKRIKIKCDYIIKNTGKIKKNKRIVIYNVYDNIDLLGEALKKQLFSFEKNLFNQHEIKYS